MMKEHRSILEARGIRWIAVILLIAAAFAAGMLWRDHGNHGYHERGDTSRTDSPDGKTPMYYCSMHPQVRSPDPDDKCPICFMDLIPLPDDDENEDDEMDEPRLRLSARAAALMDIRTWPAERRPVEIEIDLFGRVGFDESRLVDIVARTEAYVERLTVNTPWQPVAKGDALAELYSPAVVTAFRELLVARDGAEAVLEAARARLIRRGVSEAQVDEVFESGEVPRTFRVESPATGVALPMVVREGEWLREGSRLTRIADLSWVWVNLEAYERDLAWLAAGQKVRFSVAAYPGETFEGEIIFIDPVINELSRTTRLRVEADNPDGRLKPEMLVSARVHAAYSGAGDAAEHQPSTIIHPLVVPASAPLITGKRALIYVRLRDDDRPTFEPREVVLGPRAGDFYVVRDGLNADDLVVVNGQFKIDSELQIRGRPSMMAPEGGRPPVHDHGQGGHAESVAPAADQGHTGHAGSVAPAAGRGQGEHASHAAHEPRLQTHCPIMGGEINRDLYHDHNGQRIYVCCPGCLDEVRERADEIIEEQRKQGVVFEHIPEAGE